MPEVNPFTKLHNDVLEALMKAELPAEARILFALWRKTFGFGKKADSISVSQFMKMTCLPARTLYDAIVSLKTKGIIEREGSMTSFSKKFMSSTSAENRSLRKTAVRKTADTSAENRRLPLRKTADTIETLKENIKERALEEKKTRAPESPTAHSNASHSVDTSYNDLNGRLSPEAQKEFILVAAWKIADSAKAQQLQSGWPPRKLEYFNLWLPHYLLKPALRDHGN